MVIYNTPLRSCCLILALVCIAATTARSQGPPIVKDSLYSSILQEHRSIQIVYPRGYDSTALDKYEVLYCLEGIYTFGWIEHNFLSGEGFIPNLILVGLPNTVKDGVNMRDRDFTPTHTYGETGGADKFLQFMKEELMPYLQKRYPVKSSGHTLYGGSLSGLLAVYAFLKDPGLFTSYIAVEPSLWWDDFYLNKNADRYMAKFGPLRNTLWLAGREGSPYHFMGIKPMDSILTARQLPGLDWKCQLYPNETHFSTQFKGLWDGLKFSYGGFYAAKNGFPATKQIVVKPQRGVILKGKPFDLVCDNLADSPYIRYTTDGTAPNASSPSLSGEVTRMAFDKTTLVRFKSMSLREEYAREHKALFELGAVLPPAKDTAGIHAGGLHYAFYEGDWNAIPDLSQQKPQREGRTGAGFDLGALPLQTGYVLAMDGYIKIDKPGYYVFGIGGKNFRAYLNGQVILGDHIVTGLGELYMLPLAKGYYALRIEQLHIKGDNTPSALYIRPEESVEFPAPAGMLYSR
ncbi:alpha/beta hydrolase-fold protein [Chitinophaga lutea]